MDRKNPHVMDEYYWVHIDSPIVFAISLLIIIPTILWCIYLVKKKRLGIARLFFPIGCALLLPWVAQSVDSGLGLFFLLYVFFIKACSLLKIQLAESRA